MPLRKTSVNMACNSSPRTPQNICRLLFFWLRILGVLSLVETNQLLKLSQDYHVVCYGNPSTSEQSSKSPFGTLGQSSTNPNL